MSARLVWITPNAEQMIVDIARVSSAKPAGEPGDSLLRYLVKHRHWSPFEHACLCVEIETTRTVARQILRHRSFSFQEFSGRYSAMPEEPILPRARRQDTKNRQASHDDLPEDVQARFQRDAETIWWRAVRSYQLALESGIAKECARALLPEGMVKSRLYMTGNVRSWIHYLDVRLGVETQLEHREIAQEITSVFRESLPTVAAVALPPRSDE